MKYILISIIILLAASGAVADEAEGPSILKKGPVYHEGIEFLGVNALPAWYGEYSYDGGVVRVYFTREEVVLSDEWKDGACGTGGMFSTVRNGVPVTAYMVPGGWTAFLSFPDENAEICRFMEIYIRRQTYFINLSRDKSVFSFPAVLEIN